MIKLYFRNRAGITVVKIVGTDVYFSNEVYGFNADIPIDNMKLFIKGITKEFPDLADMPMDDARKEAIKRFKNHLKELGSEEEIEKYMIEEGKKDNAILQKVERGGGFRK
jgi:hypothetical protein